MNRTDMETEIDHLLNDVRAILDRQIDLPASQVVSELAKEECLDSEQMARAAFWLLLSKDLIEITQDRKVRISRQAA